MLDPRIAQRQVEREQRKKQQEANKVLQLGQNKTTPTPAATPKPSPAPQPYTAPKTYTSPSPSAASAAKQTVNKTLGGYSSPAAKGTVANTLAKAETMAESVYRPNSQLANNEYTTASQRQPQNAARQNYINRMQQQKAAKEYGGYTQPKAFGGYTNATYGNVGAVKSSYSQPTASQPKASNGVTTKTVQQNNNFNILWNKYGAQLMGDNSKPKAAGPNAEMGKAAVPQKKENDIKNLYTAYLKGVMQKSDWGSPKTIKDGAQSKQTAKTAYGTVGPNAETGKTFANASAANKNSSKEEISRWVNGLSDNKGPSRESVGTVKTAKDTTVYPTYLGPNAETAKTGFLDNRGQNIVEKMIEEGLSKTNNSITVTKENVYYQPPQKVEKTLTEVQNTVKTGISEQKRELEDLQFKRKYAMVSGSKEEASQLDAQIAAKKADIEKMQRIDRKIRTGLAFNYQFMENQAEKLSEMSIDDILKENEEFGYNLPYFSPVAQGARTVNQGRNKIENMISVLENTTVENANLIRGFTISIVDDPKNSFTVKPDYHKSKNGYYDYSLSVTANNFSELTQEQKNLYKVLDNLPISATAYKTLNEILDTAQNIDKTKLGKISNRLFAAGEVLDVIDFLLVVSSDYSDDGELGKDTTKKITGMISSWIGGMAGGEFGAVGGAAIGTAIMPGIGTVAGGAIGAVVGAYMLSSAMEDVGVYLGGLDYGTEYDLEQYIIRRR